MRPSNLIKILIAALFLTSSAGTTGRLQHSTEESKNTETSIHSVVVDISKLPRATIEAIKLKRGLHWWSEFGNDLLMSVEEKALGEIKISHNLDIKGHWPKLDPRLLTVAIAAHSQHTPQGYTLLLKSGRLSLLKRTGDQVAESSWSFQMIPFVPNTVYVRSGKLDSKPKIWSKTQESLAKKAMADVDPVRWYLDVGTLTNWNRHVSSVDVVSARDWIKGEFDELKPTSSTLQKFNVMGRDAWNVIANFDAGPGRDIYIICGHYDAISERPSEAAPGAEDNATGAAGVLELARVFSAARKNASLVFVAFSGEEQGLVGSKAFVRSLDSSTRSRIKGVLNMDMIGYSKDDSEDVLLESSSRFKSLVDHFAAAASLIDGLNYFITYNPYGSDHMPFIDAGIPAILTIDNDWGDYPSYHRTSDTIDKVSRDMGAAILRMNAGALAVLLN